MAGFYGADIEQMQQLEASLNQQAETIQNVITTIRTKLESTQWQGPDADRFRGEWNGTYTQNLNNVVQQLKQTSALVKKNWMAQQQASAG